MHRHAAPGIEPYDSDPGIAPDEAPAARPRRIAFVDLVFSWPPNGGADADLYNVAQGLADAGHTVHLFGVHESGSTDRGIFDPGALPFAATRLVFPPGRLGEAALCDRLRAAVDAWSPDLVFVTHGFALKTPVLLALAHHRTVARYYAHEHVCLRDPLRWRDGAPCPHSYPRTPDTCRACALQSRGREIRAGRPDTWTRDWLAARAYAPGFHARYRAALASADALMVSNTTLAADLADLHPRVVVVPGGVHAGSVPVGPPPGRGPRAQRIILMAGRVDDPLKGLGTLLEAGRLLAARRTDFRMVATHFDPTLSREWFTALGWLDHAGAMALYPQADICVAPSLWEEPFGLVAVEAMAAARPVVASRVGGLKDIVRDDLTGYLCPPGDAAALAECLGILLDRQELRHSMGRAGRLVVEEEYDWSRIIRRHYLPLIEELAP
jgi:glycosyltransferase involved in cell wall biosynthesis